MSLLRGFISYGFLDADSLQTLGRMLARPGMSSAWIEGLGLVPAKRHRSFWHLLDDCGKEHVDILHSDSA